jgi:hypothetical protein
LLIQKALVIVDGLEMLTIVELVFEEFDNKALQLLLLGMSKIEVCRALLLNARLFMMVNLISNLTFGNQYFT